MRNVSSDTRGTADIVKAERRNEWVGLQEQRQRLADATYSGRMLYQLLRCYEQRRNERRATDRPHRARRLSFVAGQTSKTRGVTRDEWHGGLDE